MASAVSEFAGWLLKSFSFSFSFSFFVLAVVVGEKEKDYENENEKDRRPACGRLDRDRRVGE